MHRVFVSYHHRNDQCFKEALVQFGSESNTFIDQSLDTNGLPDSWDDQRIRCTIRDDYLRRSTVTILLVGKETRFRKHIDWELYSSMINGVKNRKSGILAVMLPSTGCSYYTAAHENEKANLYPNETKWTSITSREEYERRYPDMPARIIDNLLDKDVRISVTTWNHIADNPEALAILISNANKARETNQYCLRRPMKRRNHNPLLGAI